MEALFIMMYGFAGGFQVDSLLFDAKDHRWMVRRLIQEKKAEANAMEKAAAGR